MEIVRALGLRTVIDLRSDVEVEQGRFPVDEIPVDFHHLSFIKTLPNAEEFKMAPGMLGQSYLDMVRDRGAEIAAALKVIASREAQPIVFHCTAGKDRTGVLAALLLDLLGVPHETIAEDYALSERAMVALRANLVERYPEGADAINDAGELFTAEPANMTRLFDMVRQTYGSTGAYAESIGVDHEVVAQLRDALLE